MGSKRTELDKKYESWMLFEGGWKVRKVHYITVEFFGGDKKNFAVYVSKPTREFKVKLHEYIEKHYGELVWITFTKYWGVDAIPLRTKDLR